MKAEHRVLVTLIFLVGYGFLVPRLGFFAATGAFLVLHMLYLGIRRPQSIIGVTVGFLAIFYLLFEGFLNVSLPHGLIY